MSITTTDPRVTVLDHRSQPTGTLAVATLTSGAVAAGTAAALAAVFRAGGVHMAAGGDIPLPGFATVTLLAAAVGGLLALAFRGRTHARRRFVRVVVTLAALSCLLPLAAAPGVAGKLALTSTHVIAAAIIIPVLARRLADRP